MIDNALNARLQRTRKGTLVIIRIEYGTESPRHSHGQNCEKTSVRGFYAGAT